MARQDALFKRLRDLDVHVFIFDFTHRKPLTLYLVTDGYS